MLSTMRPPIVLAFESPHLRFSCVVSALLALQISPSRPSAASVLLSLLLHISSASSWRKFSAFKGLCDLIGPTFIIQDAFPILRSTAKLCLQSFFGHLR